MFSPREAAVYCTEEEDKQKKMRYQNCETLS